MKLSKKSFFKVALCLLAILPACRKKDSITGLVETYYSEPLIVKTSEGQQLELFSNERVGIEVDAKGLILSSEIRLRTQTGTHKVVVPRSSFTTSNSFLIPAAQSGQNTDIYGFKVHKYVKSWQQEGPNQCDAGGECGYYQPEICTTTSNNTQSCMPGYWVHMTCWGTQNALFNVNLYEDSYRVEFKGKGNIQTDPMPEPEITMIRALSPCVR